MNTEKKLNLLAKKYLKDLNVGDLRPIIVLTDAPFMIDNREDWANLNPPMSGLVRDIMPGPDDDRGAVIRMAMGYTTAARITENPKLFNFYFTLWLHSALKSLTENIGSLQFREVTLIKPNGKIFSELEHSAAYELKVMVNER